MAVKFEKKGDFVGSRSVSPSLRSDFIRIIQNLFPSFSTYAGELDDPPRLVSSFAGVAGGVNSNEIAVRGNSPQFLQWKLEGAEIPNPFFLTLQELVVVFLPL